MAMFREPVLSALDAESGAGLEDGKPWILVLRPRIDFNSALVTVHASAWELIKKVLRFSLSISNSYYEAALCAMRRWFHGGAGDPTIFLIHIEREIAEGIRRLPSNYYVWRAYQPERHGPLNLTFVRFEQNNVNEHGPNNEYSELFISEAHVPFFRFVNGYTLALMTHEDCRSHILLERRRLLGPAVTSYEMLDDLTRGFYRASNVIMPNWLLLPRADRLPLPRAGQLSALLASPQPALLPSPSPAPSDAGSDHTGRVRPHRCPSCRSSFSTVARWRVHVTTVHGQADQTPGN